MNPFRVPTPSTTTVGASFPIEGLTMRAHARNMLTHMGTVRADGSVDWIPVRLTLAQRVTLAYRQVRFWVRAELYKRGGW